MITENFDSQSLRKSTVAFGALFNNVQFIKKDVDGNELKRFKVPLAFGSKEKYLAKLTEDPTLTKGTQLALPRMAFSLVGMRPDPTRKQQTMLRNRSTTTDNPLIMNSQFVPVPYDLTFELNIISREISDGLQILGMIVPNFTPDYTVTVVYNASIGDIATKDTPIILEGVTYDDNTIGPVDETRVVIWTLTFTMKAYMFGIERSQSQIKNVRIDFYTDGLTPEPIMAANNFVFANTTRGSNTYVLTQDVTNVINVNSVITIVDSSIKVTSVSANTIRGNVIFSTTTQSQQVYLNTPSSVLVTRYTANVNPESASISDNYVIDEMIEDF